jgi:2-methylisocitrate lyase-like PEP mutase family enzyme
MTSEPSKADIFLSLHHEDAGLLLPNAWDIASARLFEEAGFPAIATTSAGVAFAHGYTDGEQISRDETLFLIERMAKAVNVPLTADIEAGYGRTADELAFTIHGVIAAGAVGINLEDNVGFGKPLRPLGEQIERIQVARETANGADLHLVINARTDTYLFQVGEAPTRLEETIQRGKAYLQAGADCIFVPGVIDATLIQTLVREIPGPLNVMAGPGAPSAPELFALGVRRVSVGAAAMLATMGFVREMARELRESGTYGQMARHPYGFNEAWALFTKG